MLTRVLQRRPRLPTNPTITLLCYQATHLTPLFGMWEGAAVWLCGTAAAPLHALLETLTPHLARLPPGHVYLAEVTTARFRQMLKDGEAHEQVTSVLFVQAPVSALYRWGTGTPPLPLITVPLALCEPEGSPIETRFWEAAQQSALLQAHGLTPQYPVLQYWLDFALPDDRIGIELDGWQWHQTPEQRLHDYRRDRRILAEGWRLLRFMGIEVTRHLDACLAEIETFVNTVHRSAGPARTDPDS